MIQFDETVCRDLEESLKREWLETNGLGGFASSTLPGLHTRRYHGLLVAATKPPVGRMVLTVPVGRDLVCSPLHRIYGPERLPRLLDGYTVQEEQYWRKDDVWEPTDRETALATAGSESFYSLGLFVLGRS